MKSNNPTPQSHRRRILMAVTGLTPQIVTETLHALACRMDAPWIPDEVHVVTTVTGAENVRLNLLLGSAWFHRLLADYGLPAIAFPMEHVHILCDEAGTPLDDIRNQTQNTLAADFITDIVRKLTEDPATELHVSIAGGRKTMGYYLGYALSLYGRPHDRLSHVLVNGDYESHPQFYYPTPYPHPSQCLLGKPLLTHVVERVRVDLVAYSPRVEELQEIDPALARGAGEPGKHVVAHLSDIPVLALMPCARVIHRDRAAHLKPRTQQLVLLLEEHRIVVAEQGIDLALGDVDTPFRELFMQQRLGDVTVMVLVEHITPQFRAEVSPVERAGSTPRSQLPSGACQSSSR